MNFRRNGDIPYVTIAIVAINVIYFLYLEIVGSSQDTSLMLAHGAAYNPYIIENKEYYRLFTSMFMHFGIEHIINNMFILIILGEKLEKVLGKIKYLILYLISGIGANVVSLLYYEYTNPFIISAGASGAIFGVTGGLLSAVCISKGNLENINRDQLLVIIAISIYHGFTSTGVDNAAHLGGLFIGILMGLILYKKPKVWGNTWAR